MKRFKTMQEAINSRRSDWTGLKRSFTTMELQLNNIPSETGRYKVYSKYATQTLYYLGHLCNTVYPNTDIALLCLVTRGLYEIHRQLIYLEEDPDNFKQYAIQLKTDVLQTLRNLRKFYDYPSENAAEISKTLDDYIADCYSNPPEVPRELAGRRQLPLPKSDDYERFSAIASKHIHPSPLSISMRNEAFVEFYVWHQIVKADEFLKHIQNKLRDIMAKVRQGNHLE